MITKISKIKRSVQIVPKFTMVWEIFSGKKLYHQIQQGFSVAFAMTSETDLIWQALWSKNENFFRKTSEKQSFVTICKLAAPLRGKWSFLKPHLKFSKSPKHFFLKLYCPKNEQNIWQNHALEFKKWLNKTIKGPFSC